VGRGELPGQPSVQLPARLVETADRDLDAVLAVLGLDRVEGGGAGNPTEGGSRVPDPNPFTQESVC
jgi:hypothetical protein